MIVTVCPLGVKDVDPKASENGACALQTVLLLLKGQESTASLGALAYPVTKAEKLVLLRTPGSGRPKTR